MITVGTLLHQIEIKSHFSHILHFLAFKMPGIEDQPPTAEQVSIIRKKFQDYITENGRGMYFINIHR